MGAILEVQVLPRADHSERSEAQLANVLLDEVDRELERRGHKFVRYADDCNVYIRSQRAGERVLQALRGCYAKLALKINEAKTAVGKVWGRKFLGYCFRAAAQRAVKRAVAPQSLHKLRERIRELTGRNRGRSLRQVAEDLRGCVPGWKAYFRLAQTPTVMRDLDEWLRHRLRAVQLKQWRRGSTMYREAAQAGCERGRSGTQRRQRETLVAQLLHGPEQGAADRLLRPPGSAEILLTSTSRTARSGPARRVACEGSDQR